jgi:hypothetical protein
LLTAVTYEITVSKTSALGGTDAPQYVKIRGTKGETEEQLCDADFKTILADVTCIVRSSRDIGDYRCIVWRTTTEDGWGFSQVMIVDTFHIVTQSS